MGRPLCRKLTDGLFLRQCKEVSELYPNIKFDSMIIDNCCMQASNIICVEMLLHSKPHVIVATSLMRPFHYSVIMC